MSDRLKRLILITLVVAASSAWYFLAPLLIGERAGHVMATPDVDVARQLRDEMRRHSVTERLYGANNGSQNVILMRVTDRGAVTGPDGQQRCRSWSQSTTGSVAIEAITCP